MEGRLNEVLVNARCFYDKLDSLNVLILHLSISTNAATKAEVGNPYFFSATTLYYFPLLTPYGHWHFAKGMESTVLGD